MFQNNNNNQQQQQQQQLLPPPSSQRDPAAATAREEEENNNAAVFTSSASASASCCNPSSSSCCDPSSSSWCNTQQQQQQQPLKKRIKTDTRTDTDNMISKELSELSPSERERAYDDIHGVGKSSYFDESDEEFVTNKLHEMNVALDDNTNNFSMKQLRDYHRALFYWPQLKYDRNFKLMFLRTDDFDPNKAAKRLVNYYIQKRIIFGDSKLVKKITMDDLTPEDIHIFESGIMMEIPNIKDQCKRPIVYGNMNRFDPTTMTIDNMIRAAWYMFMMALTETEAAQQKGICNVIQWSNSNNMKIQQDLQQLSSRMCHIYNNCFPGRFTAIHAYYDKPSIEYWVFNNLVSLMGRYSRMRFRGHLGTDIEIEYELLRYGIRFDGILTKIASGNNDIFQQYMKSRIEIDNQYNQIQIEKSIRGGELGGYVPYPHPSDVLIGRGKPYREWHGNISWNDAIDKYALQYRDAETRFDKGIVAYHVIEECKKSTNVRFLLEPYQQQQQQFGGEDGSSNNSMATSVAAAAAAGGWKVLELNSPEAKDKATVALQNRVKALSREATKKKQAPPTNK